jgi:hypothetical protein
MDRHRHEHTRTHGFCGPHTLTHTHTLSHTHTLADTQKYGCTHTRSPRHRHGHAGFVRMMRVLQFRSYACGHECRFRCGHRHAVMTVPVSLRSYACGHECIAHDIAPLAQGLPNPKTEAQSKGMHSQACMYIRTYILYLAGRLRASRAVFCILLQLRRARAALISL